MKKLFIMAAIAGVALAGCDKLKEAASSDFTVDDVTFNFSADVDNGAEAATKSGGTRASAANSFTVTRTVNISEIGSPDVVEYASKISKVMVNSSLLNVTTTPAGSYTVTNLTVSAVNVSGSLVIPSYTVGGTFTPPSNMNSYTATFITALINAKSVSVTVSGETDAPTGTTVNISYENDLVFTAKLLK